MNITIISSVLPYPLNSGGAQAQFNMIDGLRHIHNITYLFIETRINQAQALKELAGKWQNVNIVIYPYLRQLMHGSFLKDKILRAFKKVFCKNSESFKVETALKPYGIYFTSDLVSFVNAVIEGGNADIVQVEFYPCLHIIDYLPNDIKKIFIHHEIRFVRNDRLLSTNKLCDKDKSLSEKIKAQELCDLNKYDRVVTLTDNDKDVLCENGVVTELMVSPAAVNTPNGNYSGWNGRILFLGGYSHKPNVEGMDWFFHDVLPNIDEKHLASVEFHLVGNGWPESLIEEYRKSIHFPFVYHGFVKDLQTVVPGCIMIVPILTGSGMRMKILDAAALGVPFITTSVGVEGLLFKDGHDCIVRNEASEWAISLVKMIEDEDLRKFITAGARSVFEQNYSESVLLRKRNLVYSF